ncbi:MAG: helix-turn-helix domain-containing protein [Acidobacteria bacterium]|nr:helix-turn-helix domain-containing protein [Acidobacteriota bacterium]
MLFETPNHDTNTSPFLTLGEVLRYLRVNARTVYRLIRSGELPATRVGRQWRIRESDLEQWLETQRVASPRAVKAGTSASDSPWGTDAQIQEVTRSSR